MSKSILDKLGEMVGQVRPSDLQTKGSGYVHVFGVTDQDTGEYVAIRLNVRSEFGKGMISIFKSLEK